MNDDDELQKLCGNISILLLYGKGCPATAGQSAVIDLEPPKR